MQKRTQSSESTDCLWTSEHWWSNHFELRCGTAVVASVDVNGPSGTAKLRNRGYTLQRFRLPPYVTIRDLETDDLVARLSLIPKGGFLAEFNDESFRLGWVNWFKREWAWTDESGGTVLVSKRPWWGRNIDIRMGPELGGECRSALLAVLELAVAKLSLLWL